MADRIDINVAGADAVARRLSELGRKLTGQIVRPPLREGAKLIAAEARANVDRDNSPKVDDTGRLKRAIRVRAGKRRRGQISMKATVGKAWFQGETFYGAFREWGHKIGRRAQNKDVGLGRRMRRNEAQKAEIAARDKARSEVRAYPFMEPAFKSKGAQAGQIAERGILAGILREAGRG